MPQLVQKLAENNLPELPVVESETSRICLAYWPLHRAKTKKSLLIESEYSNVGKPVEMDVEGANDVNNLDLSEDIKVNSFIVLSKSTNSEQVTIKCSVSLFFC